MWLGGGGGRGQKTQDEQEMEIRLWPGRSVYSYTSQGMRCSFTIEYISKITPFESKDEWASLQGLFTSELVMLLTH